MTNNPLNAGKILAWALLPIELAAVAVIFALGISIELICIVWRARHPDGAAGGRGCCPPTQLLWHMAQ